MLNLKRKQSMAACADEADNFKAVFKKYKRKDQKLDLSAVVDIDNDAFASNNITEVVKPNIPTLIQVIGLKPVQEWKICHFLQHRGFYLIKNPFLPGFQRYWVSRCLRELPLPPNVTNLGAHPDIDPTTLWSNFESDHQAGKTFDTSCPLRKLRWTTIGYHYNWNTKEYKAEDYTPFPEDIGILATYVVEVLGFSNFHAEAGIINYYHQDSTLAGHTDHSELDHEAPLVSISFGQDAIFLLGGETKATEPTAIHLRSGDICVMSGLARLAYHAVPRILCPAKPVPPPCFEILSDMLEKPHEQGDRQIAGADKVQVSEKYTMPKEGKVNIDRVPRDGPSSDRSDQLHESIQAGESVQHRLASAEPQQQENLWLVEDGRGEHRETRSPNNTCVTSSKDECLLKFGGSVLNTSDSTQSTEDESDEKEPRTGDDDLMKSVNDRIVETLQELMWEPFAAYLSSSRINVNIRQVLKPGQTFPRDAC